MIVSSHSSAMQNLGILVVNPVANPAVEPVHAVVAVSDVLLGNAVVEAIETVAVEETEAVADDLPETLVVLGAHRLAEMGETGRVGTDLLRTSPLEALVTATLPPLWEVNSILRLTLIHRTEKLARTSGF